ncbi:MAG TPA: hypothetical protein VFJ29_06180 [Candidatus Kapabacteria bacterium]|nr:hypothetical protein [Candidatus Kapabacteria bacterium]
MEETFDLVNEKDPVTASVRAAARILSIALIGYIYIIWSGSLHLPLEKSLAGLNWRQIVLLVFDLVVVAGCIVAWSRELLGVRIVFVSAVAVDIGSLILREAGFVHEGGTVFMGFAVPALFMLCWYLDMNAEQEEKRKALAHEIRWIARAISIGVIAAILATPVTNIAVAPYWDLLIATEYILLIPLAVGIAIVWKHERTGSLVIMICTIVLYVVESYIKFALAQRLTTHTARSFLSMDLLYLVCGGLFFYSSYLHREEVAQTITPEEQEAKRLVRAANDLKRGRVYGAMMMVLFADHLWIDAAKMFTNDLGIAANTMTVSLYFAAAAGVVLSLYRSFWGVRILLISVVIRIVWFIPKGASDGATVFMGLIVGVFAAFYLLRAEDAMPGLTSEENRESHATDVRLLARAISISAVVYFIVLHVTEMFSTNPQIAEAATNGTTWVAFIVSASTALIAFQDELKGGLALVVASLALMAAGYSIQDGITAYIAGFAFFIAAIGYLASFFMHAALPEPIEEETTDMEGGDVELPT